MRRVLVVIALVGLCHGEALAGWGATKIAMVRLDDDARSKRFEYLQQALEALVAPRAKEADPYGIAGVVVVDKASLQPFLGADCTLKAPTPQALFDWAEKNGGADFVLLYCSTGPGPKIQIALYAVSEQQRRMLVVLEPRNASLGRPAIKAVAAGVLAFADTLFSP